MTPTITSTPTAHAFSEAMSAAITSPHPFATTDEWGLRMAEYLRAAALQRADEAFGALAKVAEECTLRDIRLEARFGPGFRSIPEARAIMDRTPTSGMRDSDDAHCEDFCKPLWQAQRELAATPAPNLAAALFKVHLIEEAELDNDSVFQRDCMEIVQADFARLASAPVELAEWRCLVRRFESVEAIPLDETTDELIDEAGELIGRIMAMPSPNAAAARWKLDYLLSTDRGSTGSYSADYVEQTKLDYRRFLTGEAQ